MNMIGPNGPRRSGRNFMPGRVDAEPYTAPPSRLWLVQAILGRAWRTRRGVAMDHHAQAGMKKIATLQANPADHAIDRSAGRLPRYNST